MKIIPVILSGGSGNRLWPLSRKQFPKQYLSLVGVNSMLQETIIRLKGVENLSKPIIVCNEDHRFIVAEQLKKINVDGASIILEPVARNTAPAIVAAAIQSVRLFQRTRRISAGRNRLVTHFFPRQHNEYRDFSQKTIRYFSFIGRNLQIKWDGPKFLQSFSKTPVTQFRDTG